MGADSFGTHFYIWREYVNKKIILPLSKNLAVALLLLLSFRDRM